MTPLCLAEAVPLAHALVARLTMDLGVRALLIKGPVLAAQELRESRASVDVDVLVEVGGFDRVTDALADLGWQLSGPFDTPTVLAEHSQTCRHPSWPCEIDVHYNFPGFLSSPQDVFERLWESRTTVVIAGQAVPSPSPSAHSVIAALHYLRDGALVDPGPRLDDLAGRIKERFSTADIEDVVHFATATHSIGTAKPFLDRLEVDVPDVAPLDPEAMRAWEMHSQTRTHASLGWTYELHRAPWRRKPWVVWRGLWPSEAEMRRHAVVPFADLKAVRAARYARLRRGLRELPAAVGEVRRQARSR